MFSWKTNHATCILQQLQEDEARTQELTQGVSLGTYPYNYLNPICLAFSVFIQNQTV